MNNKTLAIIFAALLGLFLLSKLFSGPKNRSFDPQLLQIDTSAVDQIIVDVLDGEDYELVRAQHGKWLGKKANREIETKRGSVAGILGQMASLKILRITTKDQAKWPSYEIEEGKAKAKITFKSKSKAIQTLVVGGFRFNQQARTAQSFVRTDKGNEVYAIDGFASMSLGQNFDTYRDKTVLQVDKNIIKAIDIIQGENKFSMSSGVAGWIDQDGTLLDSTKVANYLNVISNFSASGFNDEHRGGDFQNTISVHTTTENTPFQIHVEKAIGAPMPLAITSTMFPNVVFAGDSVSVVDKLFLGKGDFLIE